MKNVAFSNLRRLYRLWYETIDDATDPKKGNRGLEQHEYVKKLTRGLLEAHIEYEYTPSINMQADKWEEYKGQKAPETGWYWIIMNNAVDVEFVEKGNEIEWFPIAWIPTPIDFPDVPPRFMNKSHGKD